jgi:phosphonate transport system substrate-binding protein
MYLSVIDWLCVDSIQTVHLIWMSPQRSRSPIRAKAACSSPTSKARRTMFNARTFRSGSLVLGAIIAATFAAGTYAQTRLIAVNAGVSTKTLPSEMEARFGWLANAVSRELREPVKVAALKSSDVRKTIASGEGPDILLVHTHEAVRAQNAGSHRIIALSRDSKNARVAVLAAPGKSIASSGGIGSARLIAPGTQSFVWAVTSADMTRQKAQPQVKRTAYQDSVPFALQNGFADYGVTRLDKDIDAWKARGGSVALLPQLPVYALIVRNDPANDSVERIGAAVMRALARAEGVSALRESGIDSLVAPPDDEIVLVSRFFAPNL